MWQRFGGQLAVLAVSVTVLMSGAVCPVAAVAASASPPSAVSEIAGSVRPADNSGDQPQCWSTASGSTCASMNPQVVLTATSQGDTTSCTFEATLAWGDGTTTTTSYAGGPDGSVDATFTHTYAKPGSYGINWQVSVASGSCGNTSGALGFTLLSLVTAAEQGGPRDPSEKAVNCSTPLPVNCATGVFWHTFTDFSVPGRGVPLDLTRTYVSSAAGTGGPFGFGWTDSYDMRLAAGSPGDVTITQEDGVPVTFSPDGSGGFTAPPRVQATLAENADGSYTFTRDQGEVSYGFSAAGRLTSESDLNGYVTRFAYNAGGQLTAVTDPAGRKLSFSYAGSRVATATDPMGRTWKYGYDSAGNLVKATGPVGRGWTFSYDGKHRLVAMTDPRGGTTRNTYHASGQVTAQVDPDNGKTTWSYSGNSAALAGGATTMTDPDGHVTKYTYSDLEMLSVTTGAGKPGAATTGYTYDPSTLGVITRTDPDGNATTSSYDADGNLLATTDPLGGTTSYTYNSLNEMLTETDPAGGTTSYSYDTSGNLLSVTDPLGHPASYGYADTAHPEDITSVTDPDGHVTTYTYDADGDVASAGTAPAASVTDITRFASDKDGERTCTAGPNAVAAGITCPAAGNPAKSGTTAVSYDAGGRTTSVTDPDGHLTRYSYDGDGNQATVTNPSGQVTSYAYNGDNQEVKVTRPGGSVQVTAYDPDGNVTSQVNAAGRATTYAYNTLGERVTVTDPLGHVTRYGYDPAGNRTTLTDAEGRVTSYSYDKDNRLTGIGYSDGKTHPVSYAYDADSRRTSMTDGTGTTSYAYDADSRLTSVANGAGPTVSYGYDAAGLLTSITYPNGSAITRGYDGAGQLTSVSDWLGNTTTFGYDHDGNMTSQAYPNGVTAGPAYDKADLLTSITDKRGSAALASFGYVRNSLGEVTRDTESGAVTGRQDYSYTQLSQLASSTAGKYGYDAAGDLTAQPGGHTQAFNADGQLTAATVPGPVRAAAAETALVSASELTKGASVTSPALSAKAGELVLAFVSANGPAGKAQQVTAVTGGGLRWKPAARSDGQQGTAEAWQAHAAKPLSKVRVTATLKYKGYDGAITVTAFSGAKGAAGAHAAASQPSGAPAVAVRTTGTDSLLWGVGEDPSHATARKPAAGQPLAYQHLDAKARATFWAQRTGTIAETGTEVKLADTAPAGDKWNLAAVEILAAVPAVRTSYAYDKDGKLTKAGAAGLGYNQASELTSYGKTASYAYDGDGLRMSKTAGGTATAFAWDQSGSIPLLIAAGNTYYVYGPDGQPFEQVTGTTPSYLLADQSGSTRLITDASGAVTGTYSYGPYGTVLKHTGAATSALRYDGQYTDAESGLIYLQARYYDPAAGQFLTLDPLVSISGEPYGYASEDPVNLSDPTGLCGCEGAPAAEQRLYSLELNILGLGFGLALPASKLAAWFFPIASTGSDLRAKVIAPPDETTDFIGFGADAAGLGTAAEDLPKGGVGASAVGILDELRNLSDDLGLITYCSWPVDLPEHPETQGYVPVGKVIYMWDERTFLNGL